MALLFADCAFDPGPPELRRSGQPVVLSARGLRLLAMLLEQRPRAVTQRELRDALWPNTHVGYTSLAQVVAEVRKAIGDQPGSDELIRTVPRVGYAFTAPVLEGSASAPEPPPRVSSVVASPDAAGAEPSADPVPAAVPGPPRRRWPSAWRVLAGAAALAVSMALAMAAGAWLAGRSGDGPPPRFTQLTFRRGVVTSARFSGDGQTVVYSALWDGGPPEVFSRRLDSPAPSASLGLPPATLLSLSSRSELAVLVAPAGERGVVWLGTLARVPLSGGPLRPVLEHVLDADWSPDGRELAAIRWHDGQFQLEYPLGRVLVRPCGATRLRVSPRGDRVALLDPEGILLVDASGATTRLALPAAHQRLAWWDDRALLVDAADSDLRRTLRRVSVDGEVREVSALAGTLVVHDVARDGRVLVHHGFERWSVRARAPGEAAEHDASVDANSQALGLSADGERLLLWEGAEGPPGSALLSPTRGGAPVRLADGRPLGLSGDAAWFLLERKAEPRLVLAPTGAGTPRPLAVSGLRVSGPFSVEPHAVGLHAAADGRPPRSYEVSGSDGPPRALTPEGMLAVPGRLPSGDILARAADGTVLLQPASGSPRALAWRLPADPFLEAVRTVDGGRSLVVREGSVPARLSRVDVATGAKTGWMTLSPPDPTGVGHVWNILVTPDGRGYAYTHGLFLEDLFLVEGLPGTAGRRR